MRLDPGDDRDDAYAMLPELYDLEHAGFSDDIDLYLRLAEVVGDPILELGCGTGRVLIPLAAAGHRVTGIDRSPPMLGRARSVLQESGFSDRVALMEGSMTEADRAAGGPFGLVIVSLNGLMHLPTKLEQRAALSASHRALDPRGMLVIDALSPNPELLATFDGRVQHEGSWRKADGTTIDRFTSRTYSPAQQRIDTELWYDIIDPAGRLHRVRSGFPMRYVVPSEIELMLEVAGFAEWTLYGSYDLDLYDDSSDRLIVTAEVTPS